MNECLYCKKWKGKKENICGLCLSSKEFVYADDTCKYFTPISAIIDGYKFDENGQIVKENE